MYTVVTKQRKKQNIAIISMMLCVCDYNDGLYV